MKIQKDWKIILISLILIIILLLCYNSTEHFQNNDNNNNNKLQYDINTVKESLASLAGVSSDRLSNISIIGTPPNISISFHILARHIDDNNSKTLPELKRFVDNYKNVLQYPIKFQDAEYTFSKISTKLEDKKEEVEKYNKLQSHFKDPTITKQIQELQNLKNLIKYNTNLDRFYKFDKDGDLFLQK